MKGDEKLKYLDEDGTPINFQRLAKETGVSRWGLMLRYFKGIRGEKLRLPPFGCDSFNTGRRSKKFYFNGELVDVYELSKRFNLSKGIIYRRLREGCQGNDLVRRKGQHAK